jgi:hypothetical protein
VIQKNKPMLDAALQQLREADLDSYKRIPDHIQIIRSHESKTEEISQAFYALTSSELEHSGDDDICDFSKDIAYLHSKFRTTFQQRGSDISREIYRRLIHIRDEMTSQLGLPLDTVALKKYGFSK